MGARTLDRLARDERVRRPDMEIVAAAVLDAGLDNIFAVDARPMDDESVIGVHKPDEEDDVLSPEQSQRLSELFDLQDDGRLTETERAELDALMETWGRAVNERGISELAARRGVPIEHMRAEVFADAGGGPRGRRARACLVARGAGRSGATGGRCQRG